MKTVKRIAALVPVALALGACASKSVNEMAASTTYNAPFVGNAQLRSSLNLPVTSFPPPVLHATLTLSQLAASLTGTIVLTNAVTADTVLRAGVAGSTTSDGITLTVVQPVGCATTFHGPLALAGNGSLSGELPGSDCNAAGAQDLLLTLGPLVRQ